jgi:hypothetical protein
MQVGDGSRLISTVHLNLLLHLIRFIEEEGISPAVLRINREIVLKLFCDTIEKSLRLLMLHAGKH